MAPDPSKPAILMIKSQALLAHESHFAGGIHLFRCLAATLAASGFTVHIFTIAKKSLIMHHALIQCLLSGLKVSASQPGYSEVISWVSCEGMRFHVAVAAEDGITEASADNSIKGSSTLSSLINAVAATAEHLRGHCTVLLDCDSLQHAMVDSNTLSKHHQRSECCCCCCCCCCHELDMQQQQQRVPFMYALQQRLQTEHSSCSDNHQLQQPYRQCLQGHMQQPQKQQQQQQQQQRGTSSLPVLVLVQNLHHLPFGPCGTAPRTLPTLAAWSQISGCLCVSHFVARYMKQHLLPLVDCLQLSSSSCCSGGEANSSSSSSRRRRDMSTNLFVMHPAAVGAFGCGPFTDLGSVAAARILGSSGEQQHTSTDETSYPATKQHQPEGVQPLQHQKIQQQQQQSPVVGMLKLSREKGAAVFFALAALLPSHRFVGVCADQAMHQTAAALRLTNVTLVSPQADVGQLLTQHAVSVLLVPSMLQEAFGLVVLDAMLRGIPVLVSDAGALPEAAASAAAAVLPVPYVQFPTATAVATPQQATLHYHHQQQQHQRRQDVELTEPSASPIESLATGRQQQQRHSCRVQPLLITASSAAVIGRWQAEQLGWCDRAFPQLEQQCLDTWASALQHVLSSERTYLEYSRRAKAAAEGIVEHAAAGQRQAMLKWLNAM